MGQLVETTILYPMATCHQFSYSNLSLLFARFHTRIIPWGHKSQDFVELGFYSTVYESDGEEDHEDDDTVYVPYRIQYTVAIDNSYYCRYTGNALGCGGGGTDSGEDTRRANHEGASQGTSCQDEEGCSEKAAGGGGQGESTPKGSRSQQQQ